MTEFVVCVRNVNTPLATFTIRMILCLVMSGYGHFDSLSPLKQCKGTLTSRVHRLVGYLLSPLVSVVSILSGARTEELFSRCSPAAAIQI